MLQGVQNKVKSEKYQVQVEQYYVKIEKYYVQVEQYYVQIKKYYVHAEQYYLYCPIKSTIVQSDQNYVNGQHYSEQYYYIE